MDLRGRSDTVWRMAGLQEERGRGEGEEREREGEERERGGEGEGERGKEGDRGGREMEREEGKERERGGKRETEGERDGERGGEGEGERGKEGDRGGERWRERRGRRGREGERGRQRGLGSAPILFVKNPVEMDSALLLTVTCACLSPGLFWSYVQDTDTHGEKCSEDHIVTSTYLCLRTTGETTTCQR
uniref:Uncharacterized protein n=1 Tax=Knipowitschia caucasica TaxID=637954 RepID=A0AAV2IV91_KNICA